MAVEITLVRHGETEANAAGVWQGTSDSPLTAAGREQVRRLGRRLAGRRYDLVVTSHLGRALESSREIGDAEVDERWRELHLGSWEGLSSQQIADRDPGVAAALGTGEDLAFGGGERVSQMVARLSEAFEDLSNRLDDGGKALVVGHGGALLTLIGTLLGVNRRGRLLRLTNTSITTVVVDGGVAMLSVFNDCTHLPGAPVRAAEGATHLVVVRHGETVANTELRWQGRTDGRLTSRGVEQARLLAEGFPPIDFLYTSPLARARDTALHLATKHRIEAVHHDGLQELAFGSWETKTAAEIAVEDPDRWGRYLAGADVVRGGTGETFAELQKRVSRTAQDLADRHHGKTIAVVSHGGASRALAMQVLGIDFSERRRIRLLRNTAMGRFVYGDRGPALAGWNWRPHLEGPL